MISSPILFWTRNGMVVTDPPPQGPFKNSEAAIAFAQAFYRSSLPDNPRPISLGGANGFTLIPAENYVFGHDGKAVAKPVEA